jgi:hypothetical protein
MALFTNAFFFAVGLYGFLNERIILLYFLAAIGAYTVFHFMIPSGKCNSLRRKIMFATWERAKEGSINVKVEVDCTNFEKYQTKF